MQPKTQRRKRFFVGEIYLLTEIRVYGIIFFVSNKIKSGEKSMDIVLARAEMLDEIERIYEDARRFMRECGNSLQWNNAYPSRELLLDDIKNSFLHVCLIDGAVAAVFYFRIGDDPTYREIFDGEWKNSLPYAVIHRVALDSSARGTGVIGAIFDFAFERCPNLKIDTHKDNLPMQRALIKRGFEYCGIIKLESGDPRMAFQKTK